MLDPLTLQRIAAKAGDGPIVVALSGGGDSVALLHLLCEQFGAARLRAVIVDHRLREGSAADAERAAALASELNVGADIVSLRWQGGSRAHEAARELRYAALCNAARKLGASAIAAGHTRDDQAETVLIRAARGSGLRGLAGMSGLAPVPLWPAGRGLWLTRPLLRARRAELRSYLRARGAKWIEDPANENPVYARVQARQRLAAMEQAGFDPMRLAALAERLRPFADRIDADAWAIVSQAQFLEDRVVLNRDGWALRDEARRRALSALIIAVGAAQRGPAPEQLANLDQAILSPDFTGATLAGARLQARGSSIIISRDRGALAGRAGGAEPIAPLPLTPNMPAIWDKRVVLTMAEPGWSVIFESGAPVLQRDSERRPLAAASPHWLIRDRVQHVLGMD